MKKLFFILVVLSIPLLCFAGSNTTYYSLYKPSLGETNWSAKINTNFDTIDSTLHNLSSGGSEVDPIWVSASSNYYNKTSSDARYVQNLSSFTTDNLTEGSGNLYANVTKEDDGETAYSWGNHSAAGYLTSVPANDRYDVVVFTFKPAGAGVVQNTTCSKPISYAGNITKAEIESDTSGSITVEVYKSSTAPPDQRVYSKISASAPMTLTSAYQSSDDVLTGWTKNVSAADTLQLKVTSETAGNPEERVQCKLYITRT